MLGLIREERGCTPEGLQDTSLVGPEGARMGLWFDQKLKCRAVWEVFGDSGALS